MGRSDIWSIVNFTYLFEILRMSFNSGFLVNALLLYLNGVADCTSLPGGCAGLVAELFRWGLCARNTHMPGSDHRPGPATLTIQKVAPENPLVIGQDPEKRGADIQASVTIPPVIFTWYEQIQDRPPASLPIQAMAVAAQVLPAVTTIIGTVHGRQSGL